MLYYINHVNHTNHIIYLYDKEKKMQKFPVPKMFGTVTVGERGQVVIPVQARKRFRLKSGDKLIVFAKDEGPIALFPAEQFTRFLEHTTEMLSKIKKDKDL
jgi:AbrB family looped-hinge helix DNA binding protein